ncbi:hypothetical protein [Actinoplanes sp. NPDC023714]|uniref:hypothetical protein n=1 Tax=Actinoplanes sp. NPDC023714 TaxID=3154322 RepID=UPI0033D281CC
MAGSGDAEKGPGAGRKALIWGGIPAAIGVTTIVIYAAASASFATVLASGLMFAGAAAVAGGLLGFLFGVPRAATGSDGDTAAPGRRYRANTNLEQISDWLTKILVGVGLVQIGELSRIGGTLLNGIAPALGGTATSVPFGGALLCYFSILGFLDGWLLTQLYLGRALSAADRALGLLNAAEEAQQRGADVQAAELRREAAKILSTSDAAASYESARRMQPGRERTGELERIISVARQDAAAGRWSPEQAKARFDTGGEGDRAMALGAMQGDVARLADLDRVIDAIGGSRSAFEQHHALLTGLMMLGTLDAGQKRRLAEAVEAQRGPGGHLKPGRERTLIADRILDATRDRPTGGPQEDSDDDA